MALLPLEDQRLAPLAKPGDTWFHKKTGRSVTVIEQSGKLHIVVEAANGRRFKYQHWKFLLQYRSTKP